MSLSAVFPASAQPSDFLPPGAVGRKDTSVTSDETQHVAVLRDFFFMGKYAGVICGHREMLPRSSAIHNPADI